MSTIEEVKQNLEKYCDEHKMNHQITSHEKYDEYEFKTYRQEDIGNIRTLLEDKGTLREDYMCIGTEDIQRKLKVYIVK